MLTYLMPFIFYLAWQEKLGQTVCSESDRSGLWTLSVKGQTQLTQSCQGPQRTQQSKQSWQRRGDKETVSMTEDRLLFSCCRLDYPWVPSAEAVLPDDQRGKCDTEWLENKCIVPCLSFLSMTSSHFPPTFSLVLSNYRCIGHKAEWLRCHCCYAWYSSKSSPWEHGPLRNIGKYSFRLTPFLPLSNCAKPTTTTPLQPLIQKRSSDWTV